MRVLLVGWPSFVHGEATAGDVLALEAVRRRLTDAGLPCDTAWSPVFRPGALTLEQARPDGYTHLVFACGPLHGEQAEGLHRRS
ncbi:MAG: polysaccharide pyruvyl transferase family protein, partial [Actinomadura rubrobrunea]|nr:polysaccharide pyruvyl transferase family protein [Actinomadura rubrobrunea]